MEANATGSRRPRFRARRRALAAATLLLAGAAGGLISLTGPAFAAPVPDVCTKYASPSGSDANPGTLSLPYRTVGRLGAALAAGVVGCLREGTYNLPLVDQAIDAGGGKVQSLTLSKGGSSALPATLRNYPGESPTLVGQLKIASTAPYVTIAGLKLDGGVPSNTEASSIIVLADNTRFIGNEITAPTRICLSLGLYGNTMLAVNDVVIEGNHIHHCGDNKTWGQGSVNHNLEHGIYVAGARRAQIQYNIIDHNDSKGVLLFSDADQTVVQYNVIDANQTGVSVGGWTKVDGDGCSVAQPCVYGRSERNTVRNNIITNSSYLGVDVNWDGVAAPALTDLNVVRDNCFFGADPDRIVWSKAGLDWRDSNVWADPKFNNASGDYRLMSTSGCIGKGLRPSIMRYGVDTSTRTSITARAALSPHSQTAAYLLQARLCSNATCTGTFGAWKSSTTATKSEKTDTYVNRSISSLSPGRSYQVRWVARQAQQDPTNPNALVMTASFILKTKP